MRFKARGYQPRFSTEVFANTVFIPTEEYALPQAQAVKGWALDRVSASGQLVKITNKQTGAVTWHVLYPKG